MSSRPEPEHKDFSEKSGAEIMDALSTPGLEAADNWVSESVERALAENQPGSVLDPPFAMLADRASKLGDELEALSEAFGEWNQHVATYGFAGHPPERLVAISIVAAVRPELYIAIQPTWTERELGAWLLSNVVVRRMLSRVLCWATCTFYERGTVEVSTEPRLNTATMRAAIERAFLRRVLLDIWDELQDEFPDQAEQMEQPE